MSRKNIKRAQLHYGETLQTFAARMLGDASEWVRIAEMNNLAPPYVSPVPGHRLAVYGDTLIIPGVSPDIAPTFTAAEDVLNRDVRLSPTGMLIAGTNGDFGTVAGHKNLQQALGIRVVTNPGELLFHLDYGCLAARLKGDRVDPVNGLLAQNYVQRAIAEDDRVKSIAGARHALAGDAILVEIQASRHTNGHRRPDSDQATGERPVRRIIDRCGTERCRRRARVVRK